MKMKKQILIISMSFLSLISCKKETYTYYEHTPDTFSFTEKEMAVEVTDKTTSFSFHVKKDDITNRFNVTVDYTKSSAIINKHYIIPKTDYGDYGFVFKPEKKNETFEVKVIPENIKEIVTITLCNTSMFPGANANPEKYFDTLRVKLIPTIKK